MNLSIKNVPEDVVGRLRQRAERNRRSLQGELLTIIEAAACDVRPRDIREVYAEIKKLGLSTPSEAADVIRADRDRNESR